MLMAAKPEEARPILCSDMRVAAPARGIRQGSRGERLDPEHARKGNCLDNGATEQVFGHLKDEFFHGRDWDSFEEFKLDLEAYIDHWDNVPR